MKRGLFKKMNAWPALLLLSLSLFSALLYGDPAPQLVRAPESPPPSVPVFEPLTLEEIQQMINLNGYNYTVGETWVFQLSPADMVELLGYRPPPVDLSHLTVPVRQQPEQLPYQLPSLYDYRDTGMVTIPKNQGNCGSCWCFAGVGEMESKILLTGGSAYDLSEENVLSCNFFNAGCGGGDDFIVVNYLTKYGASLESCAPYDAHDGTPCRSECDLVWKLCGWEIVGYNLDTENTADIETVKQALLDYGPLFVSMNASATGFGSYTGGVFEYWGTGSVNHGVLLIGWDDSLTHSHGSGAWICKNSWGTSWGESGYFKIAYGSARLCEYVSAYSCAEAFDEKETLYYYDEGGWMGSFYAQQYDTWGAVRFTAAADGVLEHVEFWAVDDGLNYTIEVYDTVSGSGPYSFSGLLASQSGSVTRAGYYSVRLDNPPEIVEADDFIVAVRFNTPNFQYPVPLDDNNPFSGESYFSVSGSTWYNVAEEGYEWDNGIRAVLQEPGLTFADYPGVFSTNSFFVVGDTAYCTDVLGVGKIACGLGLGGVAENPEGRTDVNLTQIEHDTGNLIIVGGPAVNPVATEFGTIFNITYIYNAGVDFTILCESESIYLDFAQYPTEDIAVIYIGENNSRTALVVWGYGWWGTYAASVLMGDQQTWQTYALKRMVMLRWTDANADGLVQMSEITVETSV